MTLTPASAEAAPTRGNVSHAAQLRVDGRVQEILARRVALDGARSAARRVEQGREQDRPSYWADSLAP